MRKFNFFLLFVLVGMLAFGGYCWFASQLTASVSYVTADAGDYPEVFQSVQSIIAQGSAPQLFTDTAPESADDYTLADITITLHNAGLLPAEWLDIRLTGVAGDAAVYSLTGQGTDVLRQSTAQINLKLLTRAPADTPRTVVISYYVFGIQRSIEVEF